MARQREKELQQLITEEANAMAARHFSELLSLRLDRYKDNLLGVNDDMTRGRAQEARDLLKLFCEQH